VKCLISMMSASSAVASGWMEGSVVVSVAGQRQIIKGIQPCVIARHRRTLTWAKGEEVKKYFI